MVSVSGMERTVRGLSTRHSRPVYRHCHSTRVATNWLLLATLMRRARRSIHKIQSSSATFRRMMSNQNHGKWHPQALS
eukprot:24296_6